MSSAEVLEANVIAIRDGLNDFKAEVRAALSDITGEMKSQRDEMKSQRDEMKSLRERSDENFERLSTKIDATNARIDVTNQEVAKLGNSVARMEGKASAAAWICGIIVAVMGLALTASRMFHWF